MTVHLPSAVQSLKFTPKHLSALTINIRMYEAERNIYRSLDENAAKIGLWFKLTSVAHCDDEFEHDVSYTLSPSLEHHRFDLGFRKMVSALELTHYEVFEPLIVKLVTIWPQRAVAPKHAKTRNGATNKSSHPGRPRAQRGHLDFHRHAGAQRRQSQLRRAGPARSRVRIAVLSP